jgi:hypothetical protein
MRVCRRSQPHQLTTAHYAGATLRHLDTLCVCGDVGREVIRLTHSQGNLIQGQGPYLLLTPYTHGVPHVDCEGPCDVTRTNPLLPPGRKDLETCPHQEPTRVPSEMQRCTLHLGHGGLEVEVVCNRLYTPELIIPRLFMHSNDTKAPQLPRRCLQPAANKQPNDSAVCTLAICLHICLRICLCRCVHNACTVGKVMHFDTE